MEFNCNINDYFKQRISKITHTLLPDGFVGDRRTARDSSIKIAEILDEMGVASAKAQDLQTAVTSSERLKNSEHAVYVFIDPNGNNGYGSIIGLLKMGRKKLYVFDESGAHHEMEPMCVLDFYIHESKQRMGCGKILYEHMLKEEGLAPEHLAIDRPSVKFLGFLYKHYGLDKILPQMNNYVVFQGFFVNNPDMKTKGEGTKYVSESPKDMGSRSPTHITFHPGEPCDGLQSTYGRYAANKPISTIGNILQNSATKKQGHLPQNGGTSSNTVPFSESKLDFEYASSSNNIYEPEEIYPKEETIAKERNSPAELQSQNFSCVDSAPEKLDLKFHHSPLW